MPFGSALTLSSQTESGLTLDITRPGDTFDILDATVFPFPAQYGTRVLSPFNDVTGPSFLGNFSAAVSSVSVDMGDFGQDADTLQLFAYSGLNGTGTLLDTENASLPSGSGSTFTGTTLLVSAPGIMSIVFTGGPTAAPNSLYYDNITVVTATAVAPEPATLLLLGTGVAGIGVRRWRRRRLPNQFPKRHRSFGVGHCHQ